nr:myosin-7-like [Procambarus clarkii]
MMGRQGMYGNVHGLPGLPKSQVPLQTYPRPPRLPVRMPAPAPAPPPQPPRSRTPPPLHPITINQADPTAGRRLDMLEQRLNATEQSNRALLDELMRLQQDLKMNLKRTDMGLAEEKDARSRLDNTLRQSLSKNLEYDDRLKRCEDAIKENRSAIQQMASHAKSIERTITSFQQDHVDTRSDSAQKLQEYRHEVLAMNQSKEQLERLCYSLRDEMRDTASKVDNITQEMTSLEANVRMQGRLLEDNSKRAYTPALPLVRTPAPLPDDNRLTETAKRALEGKLIQMNTTIQDLTQRLNQEAKKREKAESEINVRMNELLEDYGSTKVEKDKELRDFDEKMKELQAGFSASEKQRILMEISSVAQELSRRIEEKEVKLRNDTVNKLAVIEKTLLEENKRRAAKEKELQDSLEAQLREHKMYGDEGAEALKKHVDQHGELTRGKLGEMNNNVGMLQEQLKTHRLEHQKVLAAEITERQNTHKVLEGKIDDVDDRSRMGMAELQAALGNMAAKTTTQPKQKAPPPPDYDAQRLPPINTDGIKEQMARDVARLDSRLADVETKLAQQDDRFDTKMQSTNNQHKENNAIMGDKMQQQIDAVIFSQDRLKKQVDALQTKVQDTPKSVTNLKEELQQVEANLNKKLDQEKTERMDDDKELRTDIDRIIGKDQKTDAALTSLAQLTQDVDETQTGMKKLAEAVHVVKTSLSSKLKDETKLREQEAGLLRRDVDLLNTKYTELREKYKPKTTAAAS